MDILTGHTLDTDVPVPVYHPHVAIHLSCVKRFDEFILVLCSDLRYRPLALLFEQNHLILGLLLCSNNVITILVLSEYTVTLWWRGSLVAFIPLAIASHDKKGLIYGAYLVIFILSTVHSRPFSVSSGPTRVAQEWTTEGRSFSWRSMNTSRSKSALTNKSPWPGSASVLFCHILIVCWVNCANDSPKVGVRRVEQQHGRKQFPYKCFSVKVTRG